MVVYHHHSAPMIVLGNKTGFQIKKNNKVKEKSIHLKCTNQV